MSNAVSLSIQDVLLWAVITLFVTMSIVLLIRSSQFYEHAINLYWQGCKNVGVVRWNESINYSLLS